MMQWLRLHRRAGQLIGRLVGWRVIVPERLPRRCVVIGAPHTSGWDLAATLLLMLTGGLGLRWVAKAALFRGPGGIILRVLGGIPVRREARAGFVAQMVAAFATDQRLMLAILPEGTRTKAAHWKLGFYHIALGAGVPIVLGYADYERKLIGLGPIIQPSGDIQADFAIIRRFYAGIKGRHPERQGPIAILVDHDLGQGGTRD